MSTKTVLKIALSAIAFVVASGTTYVAIQRWNADESSTAQRHNQDTIEGVSGLSEGELVTLPTLETLTGQKINLGELKEDHLLCGFIGSQCSGCTRDAELWRDLKNESEKRGVAFYLIAIGDDLPELQRFSAAYQIEELPLLFDLDQTVGPQLRVGFLPQYVLFKRDGHVVHRWDGIRHYNRQAGSQLLAEFFQPHE
jgi:peroxiredoxin